MKNNEKERPTFGLYGSRKSANDAIRDALQAEALGFDSYWFSDHIIDDNVYSPHSELWTVLGAVGASTKKIMLGSGVTDPYRRNPAVTAQAAKSIYEITGGRFSLGIGAGEAMNLIPFGINYEHPLESLRNAINIIKLLWSSSVDNPVSFAGSTFSLKDAFLQLPKLQVNPEIFVGALGKRTRILAGELGDGLLPWLNSPESFKNRLKDFEEGCLISGRDSTTLNKFATLEISISDDTDGAKKSILPSVKASLVCERSTLKEMGYAQEIEETVSIQRGIFSAETFNKIKELASHVPDNYAEKVCIFGTVDDCISKLEKFIDAGATGFLLANSSSDYDFAMEKLGKEIIPYFRN